MFFNNFFVPFSDRILRKVCYSVFPEKYLLKRKMPFVLEKMALSLQALTVQYAWSKVINPPKKKNGSRKARVGYNKAII